MGWKAGWDAAWEADWFLYDEDPSVFQGYGPDGVATLIPAIEDGFMVTLEWASDIIGHRDGTEQRIATLLRPKQTYKGAALMTMNETRLQRSRLARYATQGAVFLLALPHEMILLTSDSSGTTLNVDTGDTGSSDWWQIGQRVTVLSADRTQSIDGVIQDVTIGTKIVLDVAPGAIGKAGGFVMPLMAVYLEPQQDFARYRVNVERWNVTARAAIFDFAPAHSQFDLGDVTGRFQLAGALVVARQAGFVGDMIVNFSPAGAASLNESAGVTTLYFVNGVTTLADVATLLLGSSNVILRGTYDSTAVLVSGDSFSEGMPEPSGQGSMGRGAALTIYDGHPVWDVGIKNDDTITDPSHALTEIVDLGGVPVSIGHATYPVWGRAVALESDEPYLRQWLKLLLATVRGMQRMFWLPTWRADFTYVSNGTSDITVRTDDDSDILAWWPAQRDRLQIAYADGSADYVRIIARVDHGDGTQTLTLVETLSGSDVTMVSWLEAVRFEQDSFDITFSEASFSMSALVRAHTPSSGELGEEEP